MKIQSIKMKRVLAFFISVMLLMSAVPSLADADYLAITTSEVRVYSGADLESSEGTLPKNSLVMASAPQSGAQQVRLDGKTGYIRESLTKKVDDIADKAVLNEDAKLYKSADRNSESMQLKKDAKVYLLDERDGWAWVALAGDRVEECIAGYMDKSLLTIVEVKRTPAPTLTPAATPASTDYVDPVNGKITFCRIDAYANANSLAIR